MNERWWLIKNAMHSGVLVWCVLLWNLTLAEFVRLLGARESIPGDGEYSGAEFNTARHELNTNLRRNR